MKKSVELRRLNRGDQFEFNGEKYTVFQTAIGFTPKEVGVKSVKTGKIVQLNINLQVLIDR